MPAPARTGAQRKADTLDKLQAREADVWVATASIAGLGHLVPLSYAWDGRFITLAVLPNSPTLRNLEASRVARLGFGPTRDVVLIDVELERVAGVSAAEDVARAYAGQADWDPREESDSYVFVLLRPTRVQAWREANELAGKLLMRDGVWLF